MVVEIIVIIIPFFCPHLKLIRQIFLRTSAVQKICGLRVKSELSVNRQSWVDLFLTRLNGQTCLGPRVSRAGPFFKFF